MRRAVLIAALAAACGGGANEAAPPPQVDTEAASIREARARYPDFASLNDRVIARTCSPNPGVCHNSSNSPDLRTAGNVLAAIGAPCNLDMPDPLQGWDGCERPADVATLGAFVSAVAWVQRIGPGTWRIAFERAPDTGGTSPISIRSAEGELVMMPPADWNVTVELTAGAKEAPLRVAPRQAFLVDFIDSVLATVAGGDTNRNGVFGSRIPVVPRGAVIKPGTLAESYLWGRITGTVPGSRMPLANAPLSNAAYAAIACWIETLDPAKPPSPGDAIDYDRCAYAKAPLDPAR